MTQRDSKRLTSPPRPRRRTTRRGLAPVAAELTFGDGPEEITAELLEPSFSSRPTRRDLTAPAVPEGREPAPQPAAAVCAQQVARGQYSISSVQGGIPVDTVSGTIEVSTGDRGRKRRRTSSIPPSEQVHLASATKREITVIIGDRTLTLERQHALALASIILTTFD